MSETYSTTYIAATLPELTGKDQEFVDDFFMKAFDCSDPDDLWDLPTVDQLSPVSEILSQKLKHGVKYVLEENPEYDSNPVRMSLEFIEKIKQKILEKFPTAENFIVCSYNWYNGVDEPISLEPTHAT